MRQLKVVLALLVVLLLAVSCAKPPKAEIDAANAALSKAAQDPEVLLYAPESLRQAQNYQAQMQSELEAKHYDKVKALAIEAKAAAEKAMADVAANKERLRAEASMLLDDAKKALPEVEQILRKARGVRGIKVDLPMAGNDLNAAKASLADGDKSFTDGNYVQARDLGSAVQTKLADLKKQLSDAVQAATRRK